MQGSTTVLIVDSLFRLLELAIRTQTNRHGDQEEYIQQRRKLRRALLTEAEALADSDPATARVLGEMAEGDEEIANEVITVDEATFDSDGNLVVGEDEAVLDEIREEAEALAEVANAETDDGNEA
jgi:hypothetical protein